MASHDLSTDDGTLAYLRENGYPSCTHVHRLSGGHSGYVFRAHLPATDSQPASTVISKHVRSFGSAGLPVRLEPERLGYELHGLQMFSDPAVLNYTGPVRSPKPIKYDAEADVLLMEDAGKFASLTNWCQPGVDVAKSRRIGQALGHFLANFHNVSTTRRDLWRPFEDNDAARKISGAFYYGNLVQAAEKYGFTDSFLQEAAKVGEEDCMVGNDVLTMGDFWTGNVLVLNNKEEEKDGEVDLFVMDFELMKPGTADFEIGQMAAEMYFLTAIRNQEAGKAMLDAFLEAYRLERQGNVDAAKVAIRIGTHFMIILPWVWKAEAGEAKSKEILDLGRELIRIGWERDEKALRESIIGKLIA